MVALALTLVALAVPSGNTPGPAQLRIVEKNPLTLRGEQFGPRETVRVIVQFGDKESSRTVRADQAGVFSVRFPGFALDRCTDLVVKATGTRGHTASFTLRHAVSCGAER